MWHIFTTRDDGAIKHHSKTHQSGGGGGRLVVFRLNRSRLSGRIDEMCNLPHQIFMPLGLNFTRYSLECSVAFGNADHLDTSSSPPYLSSPSLPPSHVISSSRQASVWARYACMNSTSCPALWSLEMKCLSCRHLCQNYGPETTLTHLQLGIVMTIVLVFHPETALGFSCWLHHAQIPNNELQLTPG